MRGSEVIFSVEEDPEVGFTARALGHPVFTQADSMEDLREMVRDAVRCHFDEGSRPAVIRLRRGDPGLKLPRDCAWKAL